MTKQRVDDLFTAFTHRMLADGVHYRDLKDLQASIEDMAGWCRAWVAAAAVHEKVAEQARAREARLTAGGALARAALYCHYGQASAVDPAERTAAQRRKEELFHRAAPLLSPPLERVEVPFETTPLPAYFRRPAAVATPPAVILLGGLDTTKEDYLTVNNLCAERGLATLAFDGPGQGELLHRGVKWRIDFERAISAVVEYLASRPDVDGNRIGIIGRSTGGHYAPKAAALDKRIKAAVAWGAMYHMKNLATMPPSVREGFMFASGSRTVEEAAKFFAPVNLDGIAPKITCPLLIVHGGRDNITPTENATLLAQQAGGPTEMLFWEDSGHCCHDRSHIVRPAMADFLAYHLRHG